MGNWLSVAPELMGTDANDMPIAGPVRGTLPPSTVPAYYRQKSSQTQERCCLRCSSFPAAWSGVAGTPRETYFRHIHSNSFKSMASPFWLTLSWRNQETFPEPFKINSV
jgi:hypothetical protein